MLYGNHMKKIHLLLLLLPTLSLAKSDGGGWVGVIQNKDTAFYIQQTTINTKLPNDKVRFWLKTNMKDDGNSLRQYKEGDCTNLTLQTLQTTVFSKLDFQGDKIGETDSKPKDVQYVVPGTLKDLLLKAVCEVKKNN